MLPSEVELEIRRGNPDAIFAQAAASEAYSRENERWENLYDLLNNLFKGYLGK